MRPMHRPGGTLPRADIFDRLADVADRFALQPDLSGADDWIACERLHDPSSPELAAVLDAERVASGQVSEHATALTVMAVYAGTVTSAAMLAWALEDVVIDMRATNVAVRLSAHHGFEGYGLREPTVMTGAPVTLLVEQVVHQHLVPLVEAMHAKTRAGRRQLMGGAAHGCAAAFCLASRMGQDVDLLEERYNTFLAATDVGFEKLGRVIRLREGKREGLFYLRNTCCLYYTSAEQTKCSSCCLDSVDDRVAHYREVLRSGLTPH
ncbi:MAG TPA: (2Fe-2S)-binding protein [Nocardioidaceae bacterium]|nr:(2Fe-2S)-binding protein [Nocardioidaceae bacterium]